MKHQCQASVMKKVAEGVPTITMADYKRNYAEVRCRRVAVKDGLCPQHYGMRGLQRIRLSTLPNDDGFKRDDQP